MDTYLTIVQVIVSMGLIVSILFQRQGSDLSGIFGGRQEDYYSRRGIQKGLFFATVMFAVLFLGLGVARLIL